jgi:hypothetical protein
LHWTCEQLAACHRALEAKDLIAEHLAEKIRKETTK